MVKMAYASFSKLLTIDTSNICPNNMTKPTLSEVLQSDPVKRLFNQPNLVIKTIPVTPLDELDKDMFWHKRNGMNAIPNHTRPPEISILPVKTADEEMEDANLLPSKIEDKKSEVALFPIQKKSCGHYEPCESIVCDVTLQQYVDKDGMSPMLAVNIEEDEINAPVVKHCENEYCDALSIDHNRCRRALIKLHRCDRSHVCDICGVTLKKRISRIYHRNCTIKNEYVHNNVDRSLLSKERMRMRELQILEIAKMKKHNYSDPAKVIETLRRNEELIIIPQIVSSQQPIVTTTTSVPTTQSSGTHPTNAQSIKINSQVTNITNIFGGVPVAVSSKSPAISSNTHLAESKLKSINQARFSNLQQNSYLVPVSAPTITPIQVPVPVEAQAPVPTRASASVPTQTRILAPALVTTSKSSPIVPSQKQYIRLTVSPQTTTVQPIAVNNWIVSPSQILTSTPVQPKTILTPVRVVPIANLISPPSLLHRTQGIPKFCIVADNLVTPVTTPNSPSVQPAGAAVATATTQLDTSNLLVRKKSISKVRKTPKLMKAKKNFFCVYCSKNITTDWYFKMHIAKHKGEKLFFCSFCDESFSNNYDMKKHITNQHTSQRKLACDKCDYTCMSLTSYESHVQTHVIQNKADIRSKRQRKLEVSEDGISQKKVKRIKCEDTPGSRNECVEKHNNKELSTINKDSNVKTNGFTFVSVKKIVDPENFKQKSAIPSR